MKVKTFALAGFVIGGLIGMKNVRKKNRSIGVDGKVTLITGGSRGLGLVMAGQLAAEGAKVAICARSVEELAVASQYLSTFTNNFLVIECDITDKGAVTRMFEQIRGKFGQVEILINNAGIIQVGPMETMAPEDYKAAMDVHFWGPFNAIHEALPEMMKKRSGRVVNIVSIGGKITFPHLLPYTTSKFALTGFSEGSSSELAKYNIFVTSVYPGLMRTGSPRNIDVKGKYKAEYAWFKISDSLPGLSVSAEYAAKRIINSMKAGDKVVTISLPTKIAVALEGLMPGINLSVFELINRMLPSPTGDGMESKKGYDSESLVSKSFLTKKTKVAEEKYNQN